MKILPILIDTSVRQNLVRYPAEEGADDVAIGNTIVVRTDVVFMVGIALCKDSSDNNNAQPSFKMFLIGR